MQWYVLGASSGQSVQWRAFSFAPTKSSLTARKRLESPGVESSGAHMYTHRALGPGAASVRRGGSEQLRGRQQSRGNVDNKKQIVEI